MSLDLFSLWQYRTGVVVRRYRRPHGRRKLRQMPGHWAPGTATASTTPFPLEIVCFNGGAHNNEALYIIPRSLECRCDSIDWLENISIQNELHKGKSCTILIPELRQALKAKTMAPYILLAPECQNRPAGLKKHTSQNTIISLRGAGCRHVSGLPRHL